MGGGIILLGIMAIMIPEGYAVVALHGIIQLVSNFTRSYVFREHIKTNIVREYLPGAILGLSMSAFIIFILITLFQVESAKEIKIDFLKPLIGIFILWFLFGRRPQPKDDHPNFFGVGLVSGLTTVFIGATGPLIAPFFLKGKLTKETIIANKAICQAISHTGKIPLFIFFFQFDYFAEVDILIPLVIAVFIGTNFGKQILAFIPEKVFQLLFRGALTVIAFKLIMDQFIPILFD
ncbi:MAG: sulfite exporter TauE/SafE family protein [Candidatus Marinimicrobia bacterium]|nr:sulfite exporter TauE/SafE family protein [Candidatus Neomarinimicrobiota bacterium]